MKFEITWSLAQWIAIGFQLFAVAANLHAFWRSRQFKKLLDERAKDLDEGFAVLQRNQPEAMAARIQAEIVQRMTGGIELFERVQNDLVYLHDEMYRLTPHPADCAVCRTTSGELDGFIRSLKSMKIDVHKDEMG